MAARTVPTLVHRRVESDELADVPSDVRERITDAVREAAALEGPSHHPKIRCLAGHRDLYRLRVGDYRAILDTDLGRVRVLKVAHRQDAYTDDALQQVDLRKRQR